LQGDVLNPSQTQVFRFADLTLDTAQGRLTGSDGDVKLRPKSFLLLCHLARNAGRVLPKDELMSVVWPDVIVTEDSLTQCISDVRRSLGGAGAGLLRTVPRRGYLFEAAKPAEAKDNPPAATAAYPWDWQDRPGDAALARDIRSVHPGSVAIMPFAFLSPLAPSDSRVFDGLVNDIISQLARLRSFHVIARGSTFALGPSVSDPRRVRDLLNVAYMVTGTVETRGAAYRLRIDLVQTDGGAIVWTEEALIGQAGIMALIDTLTDRIVSSIATEITATERRRALSARDETPDAWQSYHCGLDHVFRFDAAHMVKALGYFREATRLDPGFARAHAAESFCHYYFAFAEIGDDRMAETQAALRAAERAMQVDDGNPTAQWAYGRAMCLNGDPEAGLLHARRAVALSPSFAHAHYMVGFIEAQHGDPKAAMEPLTKAEMLSPFDPFLASVQMTRAMARFRLGDTDQAALWARRAAQHQNAYSQLLCNAALILAAAGHRDEARGIVTKIRGLQPDYDASILFRALYGLPQDLLTLFRREARNIGL
jgi:DNA-binding winged helix-turn-helix (wHTH) protein/TolB-like protein/tetratricopeptide (TPR) repeat protein